MYSLTENLYNYNCKSSNMGRLNTGTKHSSKGESVANIQHIYMVQVME
jgi:hypothetical protein